MIADETQIDNISLIPILERVESTLLKSIQVRIHRMDIQNVQDRIKLRESITDTIIACAFDVLYELRSEFLGSVYERSSAPRLW
jgi:hypothetical protein